MTLRPLLYTLLGLLALGWAACGNAATPPADTPQPAAAAETLTQDQLENGLGPIRQVTLGEDIDATLAAQGEAIFTTKCAACHKLDARYVGPPLGQVLAQRTPAFVMNMMLNPDEMVKQHPEVKALLAQYMTPMPNQNLTEEEARAVLEYLRANQTEIAAE